MTFWQGFKNFAIKGNVFDMAVGVIIGTAFGKIVTSLVNDIIMPGAGYFVSRVNFSKLKIVLKQPVLNEEGKMLREGVIISYGNLLDVTLNFFIIAFCIYLVVRWIHRHREKAEDPHNKEVPTPKDIQLLSDIKEELKKMNSNRELS